MCYYYTLFFGFAQLIVNGRGKSNGGESFLGGVFHLNEILGAEEFFKGTAAEIR